MVGSHGGLSHVPSVPLFFCGSGFPTSLLLLSSSSFFFGLSLIIVRNVRKRLTSKEKLKGEKLFVKRLMLQNSGCCFPIKKLGFPMEYTVDPPSLMLERESNESARSNTKNLTWKITFGGLIGC